MKLNLHGVVRAGHPLADSVVTAGFRLVAWEDLAMVVSEHAPAERATLAHLEMLSGLVLDGPVVPLRAGTTAADAEAVRTEVLAASAPMLRAHLDRLDGLVEVHAYLRFDEDAALRAVFEESQAEWGAGGDLRLPDRIRAGERVAQRVATWRRSRSAALLALVTALARDEAALPDGEPTQDRRAFLVPRGDFETVRAAIEDVSNAEGVEAECVGPLPAYTFLTSAAAATEAPSSRWGW